MNYFKKPFTPEEFKNLDEVSFEIISKMIRDFSAYCGVIPNDDYLLTEEWVDDINITKEKISGFTREHWISNKEMYALFDFVKTDKRGIAKKEAMKIFLETITNKEWLETIEH